MAWIGVVAEPVTDKQTHFLEGKVLVYCDMEQNSLPSQLCVKPLLPV